MDIPECGQLFVHRFVGNNGIRHVVISVEVPPVREGDTSVYLEKVTMPARIPRQRVVLLQVRHLLQRFIETHSVKPLAHVLHPDVAVRIHFDVLCHVAEVAHRIGEVPLTGSILLINIQISVGTLYQELFPTDLRLPHTHSSPYVGKKPGLHAFNLESTFIVSAKHLVAPFADGPCLLFESRNQFQEVIFKPVQPLVGSDIGILFTYQHVIHHSDLATHRLEMINQRIVAHVGNAVVEGCPDIIIYIAIQPQDGVILQLVVSVLFPEQASFFTEGIQPVGDGSYHVARVFRHHCPIDGMAFQLLITICMPGTNAGGVIKIPTAVTGQQQHSTGIGQTCQYVAVAQLLSEDQRSKPITRKDTNTCIDQLGINRIPYPEQIQGQFMAADSFRRRAIVYEL